MSERAKITASHLSRQAIVSLRQSSAAQVELIANSMLQFGVVGAVVVDRRNRIVAGYGRWKAAQRIGLRAIPVIRLEHLSDDELRAYALADNQIATKAGWDRELLAIELTEIQIALPELDIGVTGFDPGEIDAMIRVDHAGEFGALCIYEGQTAILGKESDNARAVLKMAEQERERLHRYWHSLPYGGM